MVPARPVAGLSPVHRLFANARARRSGWWWWFPGLLAGLYVVGALSDLRTILAAIYQNSDAAAAPVFAQLLAHAPAGSHVTLGDHNYYEELVALILTRGLPLHRQLWYVAPVLFTAAGLGVLLWSAKRAFGAWEAMIVGSVLVCLGDLGLETFFSWDSHGSAAVHAVVLGAALVWLLPRRVRSLSWPRLVVAVLALGLFSAPSAGGDLLFLVWGVVPFVLAALLAAWRGPRSAAVRTAALGLGTAAVAVIAGAVFASIMRADGISDYKPAIGGLLTFATPAGLGRNAGTLLEGLTSLAGGDFFGQPADNVRAAVTFVSGGLVLAALTLLLLDLRRRVAPSPSQPRERIVVVDARFAYVAFWSLSLVSSVCAYLLGSPGDSPSGGRYLLGAYIAIAALLPLLALRSGTWKFLVTGAACTFALAANYRLHFEPLLPSSAPDSAAAGGLARFAASEHATVGYTSYWDSLALTWQARFKVNVFPVRACPSTLHTLCRFDEVSISSWYTPRTDTRSFLVVDPLYPDVAATSAALGAPVATTSIGRLKVSVYPYDIASRLGHGYRPTAAKNIGFVRRSP